MKTVKFYVISEQIKAIVGDHLEITKFDRHPIRVLDRDEFLSAPTHLRVPVHHFRDAEGRSAYVAIDPDLAVWLAHPASLDVVAAANERARRSQESEHRALARARNAECSLRVAEQRLAAWHALPWFVRMWRATRRHPTNGN